MNQWSRNRKRLILSIVVLAVIILIGLPAFFLFYRSPSCGDGKLNGDETGIDCGGSCQLICQAESLPLILRGDPRIITISPNTYQVVAIVENPNNSAEVYRAQYTIKLYDSSSTLPMKIIEGETYAPTGKTWAIFEGPFSLQATTSPKRATLEWEDNLSWAKNEQTPIGLMIKDVLLSREESTPRLDAVIENITLEEVKNIDLVATLSDRDGNVFAASKTFIDTLSSSTEMPIVFTWPRPFGQEAVDIDIFVRIFPDRSFIR